MKAAGHGLGIFKHLFPNDFDGPKATEGKHDSKDNTDGLYRKKDVQ